MMGERGSPLPLCGSSDLTDSQSFCILCTPWKRSFRCITALSLRCFSSPLRHSHRLQASSGLVEGEAVVDSLQEAETGPDSNEVGSDDPGVSPLQLSEEAEKMAPKQKIRIKLRSYWVPLIEDSCKQIVDAARTTNAKTTGLVPLPNKKRIYCVLKSPHVNKDARFHFEIRAHQRLIDILYPTAQTIDSLMHLDLPAGVHAEVYKIVIKAKLDCCRCHEKIRNAICSLCACEINSNTFDEKSNTITLIGNFDPQKVKKKIRQKAGKCIESLEWSEVVKKPDSCSDSSAKKNPPAPPPTAVTDESKDKTKAGEKVGAKEKDKGSKEKKDPPSPELAGPVVIVVVPPPPPAPTPAPAPPPPEKPCPEVIACVPVVGAPVGRCHCGPCHSGCHYRPCPRPGGCSNRCDPCSISSQGCPGNCVIFTEEDTTCKTM